MAHLARASATLPQASTQHLLRDVAWVCQAAELVVEDANVGALQCHWILYCWGRRVEDVPRIPGSTPKNLPCSPSFLRTPTESLGQDSEMTSRQSTQGWRKNRWLRGGKAKRARGSETGRMCVWWWWWWGHGSGVNKDQGGG